MQRFEYKILTLDGSKSPMRVKGMNDTLDATLNRLGKEGWKVVASAGYSMSGGDHLILERPLP